MVFDWPTQRSFLRDVLTDPDEGVRLVYADWFEEQGDPLGELVRVQVELARPQSRARRDDLFRRERQLLDGFGFGGRGKTTRDIASHGHAAPPNDWSFAVVNGLPLLFLSSQTPLALPPAEWVERFAPFAIRIGYYDDYKDRYDLPGSALRALLDSPLLERCVGLDLHATRLPRVWAGMLAKCPFVSQLMRLNLNDAGISSTELLGLLALADLTELVDLDIGKIRLNDGAGALVESAALPALRRLGLAGVRVSVELIEGLANSSRFSGLRSLNLSGCRLDDHAAGALAEGSALAGLVELDVSDNKQLTNGGVLSLIRSPRLARLRWLRLYQTRIGTATVQALCSTDRFFRNGELILWGCPLTEDGLASLARSPHAALLRAFSAGVSGCTDAGAQALAGSPYLKNLMKIHLPRCQVGPAGVEALTDPSAFPALEELWLAGNPLGDRGALALAKWGRRRGETDLALDTVGLTAAGVKDLAASGCLAGLARLDLRDNPIGDEGVATLAHCADLRSLGELNLCEVGMSDAGANLLAESPHLSRELHISAYQNPALSEAGLVVLRR